jgi:hypothetical protein
MKNIIENIYNRTFPSEQEVSDELISYYENNPEELDLIIEEEEFHSRFFTLIFILGIAITAISKIVQLLFKQWLPEFIDKVILEISSEMGIAIFGGALVAYLIEFLKHKQFKKNQEFREKIKNRINEKS